MRTHYNLSNYIARWIDFEIQEKTGKKETDWMGINFHREENIQQK